MALTIAQLVVFPLSLRGVTRLMLTETPPRQLAGAGALVTLILVLRSQVSLDFIYFQF